MNEQVFMDIFEHEIVLTDSVRANILLKHPKIATVIDRIADVVSKPEAIRRSVQDERAV